VSGKPVTAPALPLQGPAAIAAPNLDAPTAPILSDRGLIVLLLGFSLSVIDFFIVNVALPSMGRDLHAGNASLELIVSAYGLSYALLLVLGGRLGDALGRRRLFMIGMSIFTLTSLGCGLAPSMGALIVGRAMQGAAAALMTPQVLATVHATTSGRHHARAVGMYGATAGLAMVVGQALGGVIVSANVGGSGWRGIFLVNVPVGLLGLAVARRNVPDTRSECPARVDVPGTLLLAFTLLCLLLPLTEGRAVGWPWWSWVGLALVPLGAVALARRELSVEAHGGMPLVPPSVLRLSSVRRGLAVVLPFFASFGGFMFIYAVVSQDALHLSPLLAGAALVPFALAFFVASLCTARWVTRFGNNVMVAGAAVQALGLLALAGAVLDTFTHPDWPLLATLLALVGFAQGLVVSPLYRVVLSAVPAHLAGAGTGVLSTSQQSALALGVALLGALFAGLVGPLGYADATASILALQALIAAGVSIGARGLPRLS
jgi:MFS family permease